MKPAVEGRIVTQGNASVLSYRLDANGLPVLAVLAVFAVLGLVSSLVLALAGRFHLSLVVLAIAVFLGGAALTLVIQADQGIREERMLYEWLLGTLKPYL
jgi:hypothetical protein